MNWINGSKPSTLERGVYFVRTLSGMGNSEVGYHAATWMGSYWHLPGRHHSHFAVTDYMIIVEPVALAKYQTHEDSLGRLICYAQGERLPDLSVPLGEEP